MQDEIQIAQIRILPVKGDLASNHSKLLDALGGIADKNVDVVVTPECFIDGYISTEQNVTADNIRQYAVDPANSPIVNDVSAWAAKNNSWVILGCTRLADQGIYNTALVINRQGELFGQYDKTHLQCHDHKYLPGQTLQTFNSDFGPFGIMICADRRWPETVRSLALQGARIIFNPTYGMHCDMNRRMMQTRSYESEIFIAFTHPLQSLLTAPDGQIITDEQDDVAPFAVTRINLSHVDEIRKGDSAHLKDRRPDIYTV